MNSRQKLLLQQMMDRSKLASGGSAPKKSVKAYKLFRVDPKQPGKLFPLFVNADKPIETKKWIDAEVGPQTESGKVKSKLGPLAYRPGWHSGDLPVATHIGAKSDPSLIKPDRRPSNQVWAEVSVPNDVDWQSEANKRGMNKQGKLVPVKAHITDQLPVGGHYRYKTNPNMTGNWLISGSMKVNRVLPDEEVERINKRAGVSDLPRDKPVDVKKMGFAKGGLVWNSPDWKPHPENDLLQPIGASKMVGDERLLSQDDTFSHGLSEFPSSKKSYRYLYHGEDNKPIGAMQIQTTGPRSKKAVIQNLYVAEANRRQGIASKLLDRARQDFDVKHSTDLTTAGKAFAKAKKASGGSVMGINVASDRKAGRRYADLIVDGHKTLESRNGDSLRPYVGKRVAIVRTGEGPAKAIGEVTIGEPMVVNKKKFRSLEGQHHVPEGSAYDISTPTKHLYPLHDPVRYDQERDVGHGILSRKVAHQASGGSVPSMDVMRLAIGGQGPKNWIKGSVEQVIDPMLAKEIVGNRQYLYGPELDEAIQKRIAELQQAASQPGYVGGAPKVIAHLEESLKAPDVNKAAVNQWIQRNLSNYIKKQMATHDDPIRKLAEQGITHMPPEQMGYGSSQAEAVRKVHGAPRLGQSEAAQAWEDAADVAMHPHTIEEMRQGRKIGLPWVENAFEPWMREADPNTKVFRPTDSMHAHYLGFDHLVDVLKADLTEGRIRPEQLSKVSIEQAVRRAHEYDQAKKKAMQQASLKATEGMPVVKEYPNGYKWIELKMDPTLPEGWSEPQKGVYRDPEGNQTIYHPNYQKLQDALNYEGEVMGHCADTYGHDVSTGKSRIFSLRDQNNEPHITIETQPQSRPHHLTDDDFKYLSREEKNAWKAANEDYLAKHPREREDDNFYEMGHGSEYAQKAAGLVWQNDKIAQIKGKGNARPHDKYVPYAQDFVKSGKWANRGNREIENANLRDVMKTPALHDWLRKNEVQHERFMTPQEYSVHEKNFVDETNQRPDAGPKPMATGGVVNAESYFFPSKE